MRRAGDRRMGMRRWGGCRMKYLETLVVRAGMGERKGEYGGEGERAVLGSRLLVRRRENNILVPILLHRSSR